MVKMSSKGKKKGLKKSKPIVKLNRKELRKEKRKDKKVKRNDYYSKKGKQSTSSDLKLLSEKISTLAEKPITKSKNKQVEKNEFGNSDGSKVLTTEELHRKEKREQMQIQKDMSKQRRAQMLKANEIEDQTIKKLEKQLKLNKKKAKAIPKSFAFDGLDYLLEVCDPEYMKNAAAAEQDLNDGNDNFEEDFALMTGQDTGKTKKKTTKIAKETNDSDDDFEDFLNEDDDSNTDIEDEDGETLGNGFDDDNEEDESDEASESDEISDSNEDLSDDETNINTNFNGKRELVDEDDKSPIRKKQKKNVQFEESGSENEDDEVVSEDMESISKEEAMGDKEDKNVWEDIYGRLRSKDGAIVKNTEGKYIPPAIRARMEAGGSEDKKRKEKLDRLKKQLKGLINRLAESNMHSIASQIEVLYMNNSRHDMSETLTSLVVDSLIGTSLAPERLLMEHILLIAVLHANVGTEVGAYFLQTIIRKFDMLSRTFQEVEDKSLDNIVNILAQLYNFKVFDAKLLYEILSRLASKFEEKNVECILHVLKSVGFGLRKDDPLALKSLILDLQKHAATASEGKVSNSRVKFLLDVLLAIKNNNVTKIPNYDTTYSEHLKKIMKGFIRKGNYVTPLNISLEDLLKADERGKWWVVGSAWTGNIDNSTKKETTTKSDVFSQKLLDLARKQRMNTDTRRDIFCILMSAEDFLDAFEKLLKLGLKNQQEREIIHVLLHCCLQEKTFNAYYAILAQKFCEYDRKFQMTIKCSVWDKLKALNTHSGGQLSNLAKLVTHLFIEKGLPISTLKIVEFSELDKITLRLMRQILLGILLHKDLEAVQGVFEKVSQSDKLKMFRESLRLFIHHFLLRNLKTEAVPEDQKQLLEERAKMVEKILTAKDSRLRL